MRRGAPARAHPGAVVHLAPARPPLANCPTEAPALFVPAVVEASPGLPPPPASQPRHARRPGPVMGIEVEMDGTVVRIGSGASPQAIAAVIWAPEGGTVIGPTGAVRVMMATRPVDSAKGSSVVGAFQAAGRSWASCISAARSMVGPAAALAARSARRCSSSSTRSRAAFQRASSSRATWRLAGSTSS